jgi:hypothetical protein
MEPGFRVGNGSSHCCWLNQALRQMHWLSMVVLGTMLAAAIPSRPVSADAQPFIALRAEPGLTKMADGRYRYDFGHRSALNGEDVVARFDLENASRHDVLIASVQSSCGCTTETIRGRSASGVPLMVTPGEPAEMEVRIGADYLYPGPINKSIKVCGADAREVVSIDITGTIDPAARFLPAVIDFKKRQSGDPADATVAVVIDSRVADRIDPMIAVSDPDLQVTPLSAAAERLPKQAWKSRSDTPAFVTRRYRVSLVKSPRIGHLAATLSLRPKPGEVLTGRAFAGCWAHVAGDIVPGI